MAWVFLATAGAGGCCWASTTGCCWATVGPTCQLKQKKQLKEVNHCLLAFWMVWLSSMGKGWAAGLATMKTLKKNWDGTWSLALDLVVNLARFDTGSCIHWWKELKNGKALCAIHKTQGISKEWDGVMGSTIGAHVQKHCVLKKDSKSIVCSVSKQWYSTKCSNKQKKSSGFDGGLGGSVGASSYKHIIHTWKGPQTLWFQKKMVQVLCWQELLQPAKNIWHTHIYRYVISIK